MDVNEKFKGCLRNFKNVSFLLKFTALVLDTVNILLWRVPEDGSSGAMKVWEECVFALSVPTYMVVLSGMVVILCQGERPGKWFHRLFFIPGACFFTINAIVVLLNYLEYPSVGTYPMVMSILCFLIAFIMLLDVILHENFCGLLSKTKIK
uniref:Uncharacterized protein n=1 Tax=Graphocephala atropunctata TaxID=36148 RepID=A0A1B6LGM8_9HEMI